MQYISYIFLAVFIITIIILVVRTRIINNKIKMNGTETEAVVTRITEQESSDVDGGSSISYSYYVTYRTQTGQTVEAKLTSGNSLDKQFGKNTWDSDLYEGKQIRIKYLPDKPDYVIRL